MSFWFSLLNDVSVCFFGSVLSASFCDALDTRKNRRIFVFSMILMPLLQGLIYYLQGAEFMRQIYPLVVHLPLLLLLYILTGRLLWPLFSILTAYLCCQLRRWIALFAVAVLSGGTTMQDLVELLLTLPLLLLLLRYASPVVRQLSGYPAKIQCQFGSIPALYYVFDYLTTVYTDLLASGAPVVVEFMPFVCCAAYLVFLLYNSVRERTQNQLKQAQSYIAGICKEIEAQKVQCYCENEAPNLILSAFAGRAKKEGIQMKMKVKGTLPSSIPVSDSDLCVLLSNALENTLHACQFDALTALQRSS